jgi:hypothetical protein
VPYELAGNPLTLMQVAPAAKTSTAAAALLMYLRSLRVGERTAIALPFPFTRALFRGSDGCRYRRKLE